MDLNHLIIFKNVADAGGFSAAATHLGLPKSSVSQKVSALEQELGVRLLHRTTRRVSLTEEGERVYESASRIAAETAEVTAFVHDAHEEPSGLLRMTAPPDFGAFLIAQLKPFLARYPKIEIELDLSSRLADLVREGMDLALRASTSPLKESSLVARPISTTRLRLFASPSWIKEHKKPKTIEALAGADAVWFQGSGKRQAPAWRLTADGGREAEVPVRAVLRLNDFHAVKHAALAGFGIALLPEIVCAAELEAGSLVPILSDWTVAHATFYAVFPTRRHVPAKTRAFVEFLAASFKPSS